jgi:hypothetical protein
VVREQPGNLLTFRQCGRLSLATSSVSSILVSVRNSSAAATVRTTVAHPSSSPLPVLVTGACQN